METDEEYAVIKTGEMKLWNLQQWSKSLHLCRGFPVFMACNGIGTNSRHLDK